MTRLQTPPETLGSPAGSVEQRFHQIKKELHQQLLKNMDVTALGRLSEPELRLEVRRAAEQLCRISTDLLNLSERERLVSEVLDETFGLGPLEPLMRDPTDHRHPDQRPQGASTSSARAGWSGSTSSSTTNGTCVQIVQRIVGRVGRRVDETRPMVDARLRRRQPRQRDHPAAGPGRHPAVDPAVRRPAAADRAT